jgi:hypothetical protein
MRHPSARRIIIRLLQGQGFGEQAVAQDLMAALQEQGACPDSLAAQLAALTDELGTDSARPYQGPINQAAIPHDGRELCAQLLPAILDQPADIGLSLACLATVVELWPFVSSQERPLVRVRFMNGLLSRRADAGSQVAREQLRSWQRDLPTEMCPATPTMAGLQRLLSEVSAEGAYRCLAEHLDPRFDLRTLAHVLGTLAVAVLRQFHDRDGDVLHVLLGATGLERLCGSVDPELIATALAQLGHQLWWCRQRAHLPPIRTCIDPSQPGLRAAITSGDVTLAQRAARALSNTPSAFWTEVWALLEESLARRDEEWPRALSVVGTILYRSGTAAISPDDAAALAAVVTDMVHQRERILLS